jgi:hypothetical protein
MGRQIETSTESEKNIEVLHHRHEILDEAVKWYQKAAKQGQIEATYRLGVIKYEQYHLLFAKNPPKTKEKEEKHEQLYTEAIQYITRAANNHLAEAKAALTIIDKSADNNINWQKISFIIGLIGVAITGSILLINLINRNTYCEEEPEQGEISLLCFNA